MNEQRVKLFLEKASGVVAEKFIGPFLLAVRELVRRLRAGETAKDDLDAVRAHCTVYCVR